jgi:deoxyribodipyrimidine photo-lyase
MSGVMWFRRDLRLDDNPAWAAATRNHDSVVALFVVDDVLWESASVRRRDLLGSHLGELDGALRARGGRLRIERGTPSEVVPQVCGPNDTLYFNRDYTPYAVRRDAAVRAQIASVSAHDGCVVHSPEGIRTKSGHGYKVFTAYWNRWSVSPIAPSGDASETGTSLASDTGVGLPQHATVDSAGEAGAVATLERFLASVDSYDSLRNVPALDATSRMSAHLKYGTISPTRVIEEVGDATPGRQAFIRQIAWRDFYAQVLYDRPDTIDAPFRSQYEGVAWRNDPTEIAAWEAGLTGFPIVDAGMRQLAAEGFMHNRVRMITASFLVKDLLVDWRIGERWFRHHLIDADVAQNVGNWQWVAGTGVDAAPYFRIFNPTTQSKRFDPEGAYIQQWVPEVADVAPEAIHAPWDSAVSDEGLAKRLAASGYPRPIVDHQTARIRAINAYRAAAQS